MGYVLSKSRTQGIFYSLSGELVGAMTAHFDKVLSRSLSVRVSNDLEATTGNGGKRRGITVQTSVDGSNAGGDANNGFVKAQGGAVVYNGIAVK